LINTLILIKFKCFEAGHWDSIFVMTEENNISNIKKIQIGKRLFISI